MAKRDYYDILGISKSADEKEIKRAYRKLAKKYHPDTNAGNQYAEQKFKEITEAYNVLSDPEKRDEYDKFGFFSFDGERGTRSSRDESGFQWSTEDLGNRETYTKFHFDSNNIFGDLFDEMFESGFRNDFTRGFGSPTERRGYDVEANITISFEEAALGCYKKIRVETNQKQSLEIHIPAGIDEGQCVRLKGKGYPGREGGAAGDLILKVHIAEKGGYERHGMDIYTTENIPYTTAVLGGNAVFHTLYGDVQCVIPAGTQSGSKIRLKQKGIVSMKNKSLYGDAYVTIQIKVPKTITPQEQKKLKELQKMGS